MGVVWGGSLGGLWGGGPTCMVVLSTIMLLKEISGYSAATSWQHCRKSPSPNFLWGRRERRRVHGAPHNLTHPMGCPTDPRGGPAAQQTHGPPM